MIYCKVVKVAELTPGQNGVIAHSSTYTNERHITESSTTVNDGFGVTSWDKPNYISRGKGHDFLGPTGVFWVTSK